MKIDCRRCGAPIPIPPEATLSPETTLACPACGARYARRKGGMTATSSAGAALRQAGSSPPPAAIPVAAPPASTAVGPQVPSLGHPTVAFPAAEPTQFRAGDRVAGRYQVRRFIARGGMGEVYEAEDSELRQVVALKTVHPRESRAQLAVDRFKREIHLARRVTHPNVCRIYDVGYHTTGNGEAVIFLSMELLEGETLAARLRREGPLDPEEALPIALQMMDALGAAHAAGVVHRDFKSENVFLVPAGEGTRVVVTDFGVARGIESDQFASGVTVADAAVGTPAYMAPEQIEGVAVTPAIDQYALGVVLFEVVTGQLPFAGETPIATAVKRLTQPAPAADELRPGLDPLWVGVIRRCLARRPDERFASVRQAREALAGESAPGREPASESAEVAERFAPAAGSTPSTGLTGVVSPMPTPGTVLLPAARPAARRRRKQIYLLAAVSVLLLLAVAQAVLRVRKSLASPFAGLAGGERRAVAIVPFRNLAQRSEFDWLSVALAEMVASEIRSTKGLRAVSGEAVARAGVDLDLQGKEVGAASLDQLRERLGADFVVDGSFTVLGSGPDTSVRLAVRVDDARSRELLGEAVETGGEKDLFDLVGRVGGRLREVLGGHERAASIDNATVTPKSPRAARFYSEGVMKLRAFEPQAALELLEQAKEAEPENAMIRSALASAWAALGFEQRAGEEATDALKLGGSLPPEDRFAVEALAAELRRDWQSAGESWRQLWRAFPDNLDYGLKVANAEIEVRRPDLALATIAALRELPEPDRDNPRIDLAEAAAAAASSSFARQLAASERAVTQSEALGAPLLVAEAKVRQAEALRKLGRADEAEAASGAARELYRAAGDRIGEATALTVSAGALFDRGELQASQAANEEALASYREAGDRSGIARTLNALAVLARNLADPERARALYAEALATLDEVGDRRGTAYTRGNLAAVMAEEGRLGEARAAVDDGLKVLRELGDKSGTADALLNLGVIERQLGALDAATTRLEESLALKRELGLRPGEAAALAALGAVALDRGRIAEGKKYFDQAADLATATDSRSVLSNAIAGQGEIEFESGATGPARELLASALAMWQELGRAAKIDETRIALARVGLESAEPRAALAEIESLRAAERRFQAPELATKIALLEARTRAALGRTGEAREALARARDLASRSENPATELQLTATALALDLAGVPGDALGEADVERAVTVARQRGFEPLALEIEILRARRTARQPGGGNAKAALEDLAKTSSELGLERLARQARDAGSRS